MSWQGSRRVRSLRIIPNIMRPLHAGFAARPRGQAPTRGVGPPEPGGLSSGCGHGLSSRPHSLDRGFLKEKTMTTTRGTKFVHEGDYVATVEIEWLESEAGWSPYLSWQDAQKLDDVR